MVIILFILLPYVSHRSVQFVVSCLSQPISPWFSVFAQSRMLRMFCSV